MIIDAHTHIWPDDIARQVLTKDRGGNPAVDDGTVASLTRNMARSGVDRSICLGVAQAPKYVRRVNEFLGTLDRSRFTGFGTIHPSLPAADNIAFLRDNGLPGIKIHPLYQDFSLDDPGLYDLLEAMAGEFTIIAHVGDGEDEAANHRGEPQMITKMAERFPGTRIIACHFGGYQRIDDAEDLVVGQPTLNLETAWPPTVGSLPKDRVRDLILRHGGDRVVFGSDWPMADPATEIAAIRALDLPPDVEAGVLGGNIARLLGIEAA